MQIVVTELPIAVAVGRARNRFQKADERLSRALAGSTSGLPWVAPGVLAALVGALVLMGIYPLSAQAALVVGMLSLLLGGAFLGYGLPLWSRARKEKRRRTREWQHALELLRLREKQAQDDPALTVEVLDRVDRQHPPPSSGRSRRTSATTKYLQ